MEQKNPQISLANQGILPGIDERILLVGKTRFGKSTLALYCLNELLNIYPTMELLIIDTKPHFRASHTLNGMKANFLYRNWTKGDYFESSVVLPAKSPDVSLDYAFDIAHTIAGKKRGATVICQTDTKFEYPLLAQRLLEHYRRSNKKRKVYIYLDEAYSLLKYNRAVAEQVTMCVTAGGERGVGVMAATQRPRWIPVEMLSEITRFFVFRLDNGRDKANLRDNGLPPRFRFPVERYVFRYYNALNDDTRLMRLNL